MLLEVLVTGSRKPEINTPGISMVTASRKDRDVSPGDLSK